MGIFLPNRVLIRLLLSLFLLVIFCSFFSACDSSVSDTKKGPIPTRDSIKITCLEKGNRYHLTCQYNASGDRLILIAVVDNKGKGRRISRKRVKPGQGQFSWSDYKSRVGNLVRASAAMHKTSGQMRTTASDIANF